MQVQDIIQKGNRKLSRLSDLYSYKFHVSPGHFYSPLISDEFVRKHQDKIFQNGSKEIKGVDLNEEGQLALLEKFKPYYQELPFKEEKQPHLRYALNNEYYDYADGFFLHAMIRHFKPKRIIEVGSGFSSAVMLDTNDLFFDNKIDLTFIEPYPDRLKSILKPNETINLHADIVQEVDPALFTKLEKDDILFVDTSHVVKTGSELNYLLFNIFPLLNKGVKIHIHDIFFPFEYPKDWVLDQNRGWNEAYFLRSFLMYNQEFEVTFFNSFMEHFHADKLRKDFPLVLKERGTSLWLTRK